MPLGPPDDPDRFETFDECVNALSNDPGLSEADAEQICGAWENRSMSKQDTISKRVDFVTKDDAEQQATGIVMVPDKADLQQDFAREDTIRSFAEQFGALEAAGEASGGLMHAAWPEEWMSLERNEVLNEAADIGGTEAPAGAWVQTWEFNDDQTWALVDDGIISGYSIGAIDVSWDGPHEPDDVENVALPDELPEDAMVWELTDGIIREVSAVDIPAVPDAEILETKADAEKRLGDYLGNRDGFIEEAMDRGHSEAEAERLWENLNRALEVEGAHEPGKESVFERVGKALLSPLLGDGQPKTSHGESHQVDDEPEESDTKDAAEGDTSDDTTDMSNDADGGDGADKSLAETNAEQINELTDAVKSLTEAVDADADPQDDDPQKTAEVELPDGSVAEISKAEAMSWFEDGDGASADEVPATKSDVQELHERLDSIARQSGGSQQLDQNSGGDEADSGLDDIGKALS